MPFCSASAAQEALPPPAPSAARILLLPRRIPAAERATLAVLDVNGRLTPGVTVSFSDASQVTTDSTGRAAFLAPPTPGPFFGSIAGRPGRVQTTILAPPSSPAAAEQQSSQLVVRAAPRVAALADRFEISGTGFSGDADANHVMIAGRPALVLAASATSLLVLPPDDLVPGDASVSVESGRRTAPFFLVVFVALELDASSAPMAPGARRTLLVRIRGASSRVVLEARNLAPDVAELSGGNPVRVTSTGGSENAARFELLGRSKGSFLISIRLLSPLSPPRP